MQLVNFEGFEPGLVTTPLGLIVNSWVEEFLPSPWPVLIISSWAVMGACQPTHLKSCGLLYVAFQKSSLHIVGNHRHKRDICICIDFRARVRLKIDCKDCRLSAIRVPAPLVACNRSWDSIGLNENLQLLTNFRLSLANGEQQSKSFFAWHHLGCAHCFRSFVGGSLLGTCSHRGLEGALIIKPYEMNMRSIIGFIGRWFRESPGWPLNQRDFVRFFKGKDAI